ncbi:FecCD family ABC transporter permease [Paracoccus saliphilus]|uniref:Iron ABC transporter permease n=1 Tax=Paracoccus saliphilus TaxID=405559 RepID=A0AA45W8A4_9RHOB|nr:iron ABC transporter permease [Paracoccus saliphilus]WCR02928.1 iron ABC transporter permease [Paracoccus saliphilus]SIT15789.1 iron complex transport system permease protein [Paracoccus saliphilus]
MTGRIRRSRRLRSVSLTLLGAVTAFFALTLMLGQSFTPPGDVLQVLLGQDVPGASFTVGQLRLPRAVISVLAGISFGLGGVAFQVLLRNPLASPDIIGVSAGASAAAVFGIVFLSLDGAALSGLAIAAGLGVALLIYVLSFKGGVSGSRLILIGIGVSAMIDSFIAYALARAPAWDLQEAMRWLSGSVNGTRLEQAAPLLISLLVFGGLLFSRRRDLEALRMGDDLAAALGVRVGLTRLLVILGAVGMIATTTATTGPIAFVAFLSGPIAARIVGPSGSILIPSALIGASLVLIGDYVGQFALTSRYPVGVVTGALGAPFLIYLIIRANRTGSSL